MSTFGLYFKLGFQHITDINGFDHILFLIVLAALYSFKEWKSVIVLATAFTVGHSISLAIVSLNNVSFSNDWIEFLIPCTILATAIGNLFYKPSSSNYNLMKYGLTLFFGLIHGMGFSLFLQALASDKASLLYSLLAFNLGLEIGQIIIISLMLIVNYILCRFIESRNKLWNYILSVLTAIVSIYLMIERFPL